MYKNETGLAAGASVVSFSQNDLQLGNALRVSVTLCDLAATRMKEMRDTFSVELVGAAKLHLRAKKKSHVNS